MVANKLRPLIMEKKIIPIIIAIGLNPIKGKKKKKKKKSLYGLLVDGKSLDDDD